MDMQDLNSIRKSKNITIEELSKRSGIPQITVERVLYGKTPHPRIDTLQALERALGVEKEKPPELSDGEKALLELFSRVPADKQALVLEMIRVALKSQE